MTIPLALVMGFYMFRWRVGAIREATIVGIIVMLMAVVFGKNVAESSIGHWFALTHHQVTLGMGLYTIAAAGGTPQLVYRGGTVAAAEPTRDGRAVIASSSSRGIAATCSAESQGGACCATTRDGTINSA